MNFDKDIENRHSLSWTLKSLLNKKPIRSEYWQKYSEISTITILTNLYFGKFTTIKLIIISKLTLVKYYSSSPWIPSQ